MLRCAGLSVLVEKYGEYLNPYTYNEHWQNHNTRFNSTLVLSEILKTIQSNPKALGLFLNEFFSRLHTIDEQDIVSLINCLESLGYKLNCKEFNKFNIHVLSINSLVYV